MNSPVVTDVFKFVAVRPAQKVTEKQSAGRIIRDERGSTVAGRRELATIARELSQAQASPDQSSDASVLAAFVDGYLDLVRSYDEVDPERKPAPDASNLMKAAGLVSLKDGRDPKLLTAAWSALYRAHASGPDAGPRLEAPMAVLRLIHFAQSLANEPRPTRSAALEALRATIAIPTAFDDAFHPAALGTPKPIATGGRSVLVPSSEDAERTERIRALAADIAATQRLLDTVVASEGSAGVPRREILQSTEGWSGRFSLTTAATLVDALPARLSRDEVSVLERLRLPQDTSAPRAAQILHSHLQVLTDQSFALADDPEFLAALKDVTVEPLAMKKAAPTMAPDVDVSGRITPLGIGDLKVVKQTLLAYEPGEVAHIENVLKGESKERVHRKLDRTETTLFVADEEVTETQRDTQSTDRFELKREAELTIKEDMSVKAGLTVTATYGPVVATATGDFAYASSKQESEKNSSNFAREVVDKSVTKVQTKKRTERTTRTLSEAEETNRHGLDNTKSPTGHITGIYRWVDKRYRAQVYNYGVRLLLEFVIPEPAAFYRTTHLALAPKVNAKPPFPFLKDPGPGKAARWEPLTVDAINEFTYARYVARYGASGVAAPPPLYTYVALAIAPKEGLGEGKSFSTAVKDLVMPAGYKLNSYSLAASILWVNHPQFNVQVRGDVWEVQNSNGGGGIPMAKKQIGDVAGDNTHVIGAIPVSVTCYDVQAFALNVQAVGLRTDEAYAAWKLDTFTKIQTAYLAQETAYQQKVTEAVAAAGIAIQGQSPARNRLIEKTELKKLCITMMTGQHFTKFGAITEPQNNPEQPPEVDINQALADGPVIQFFEQAFEWEQMTYLCYPYFWGRKTNWTSVLNQSDTDPMFQEFLTAGAARVLVPVPLAYKDDVQFLLQNPLKETDLRRKVWRGGERPTLGSPLYESIAEELRNRTDDLAGAIPEGDPWEFTLPTTLVWLQPDATLPSFP